MARPEEPARAGKGYPLRQRPQTFYEQLMPHAQFEALKQHQQARRDRGVDSDEETVREETDKTKDKDEDEDDLQEEPAPLEARIRTTTVDMFKRVLLLSQGMAEALYNDQMVTTLDVLQDLTNNIIKVLCCAIRKPGGDGPGHQISKLSVTRLKMFAFWARHMWRISRGVDDWTDTTNKKNQDPDQSKNPRV
jgi:hypothetical protein